MTVTVRESLASFADAVTAMIDTDRGSYTDQDWLDFTTGFEQLRNQLAQVDHQIVAGIDRSGLADRLLARHTTGVLSRSLRISSAEARRRVDAAEALAERRTMLGEPIGPRHPELTAVQLTGLLGRENQSLALSCLHRLTSRFGAPPEVVDRVEHTLAAYAADLEPDHFARVCDTLVDTEYPDGLLPDAQVAAAREVRLTARKDGSYTLAGSLTGECGTKLAAVLDTYARPAPTVDDDGRPVRDPRRRAQRTHDGLQTACEALLRSGTLPQSGGVPTSVTVTIALADLTADPGRTGAGTGLTGDGQHLSPESVGRLLNEAEILPTVVDPHGNVVWQGRQERLASAADTRYLIARDGGCSFPHCEQPASHCERHHIVPWRDGGLTTVTNLTLLCGYHHREFEKRGWRVHLRHGVPAWTPPRWVDPDRTPRVHPRITVNARHLKRLRT